MEEAEREAEEEDDEENEEEDREDAEESEGGAEVSYILPFYYAGTNYSQKYDVDY